MGLNFGTGKLGLPEFDFTNIENFGRNSLQRSTRTHQPNLSHFSTTLPWLKGAIPFKFGGEFRRASISNFNDNLERGIYQFTAGVGLSPDPVVDALADFYTGGSQGFESAVRSSRSRREHATHDLQQRIQFVRTG